MVKAREAQQQQQPSPQPHQPLHHTQQPSLWGRFWRRTPPKAEHLPPPLAQAPTTRALTTKDALWTLDAQGRPVYAPLVLGTEGSGGGGAAGTERWAAREWQHCSDREGVLVVAWPQRYDPRAPLYWRPLADGGVRIIEGGQAG